uniref:Uncharacterized protein n=1 Tax=Arundo donax TaxID=35708 RepID=A0A0A9BI27_ARUDO
MHLMFLYLTLLFPVLLEWNTDSWKRLPFFYLEVLFTRSRRYSLPEDSKAV